MYADLLQAESTLWQTLFFSSISKKKKKNHLYFDLHVVDSNFVDPDYMYCDS